MQDLRSVNLAVEQPTFEMVENPKLLLSYLRRLHAQRLAMLDDLKAIKAAVDQAESAIATLQTFHP